MNMLPKMRLSNRLQVLLIVLAFGCLAGQTEAHSATPPPTGTPLVLQADSLDLAADSARTDTTFVEETESKLGELKDLISFTNLFLIALILVVSYFVNRFLVRILDNISERSTSYRLFIKRLVPVVRILIWSFSLYIIIAGIIDPPFETVLTVTASIGIAVGFASQDILKNVFGGFIIILDRPFQVGDKIEVGIGGYYGEVLQIGLRSCRVVTPDDSVVTIPNGELMNKSVSNANSSALDCQVVAEIYLPAEVDLTLVKRIAYKAAISSRYVYLKKPVVVIAKNEIHEKNFVVKLRVKAYVLDIRYEFPFQSDVTELILAELNRRNMLPDTMITAS